MADETLLALAADIVSAHVSNNQVEAQSLPEMIRSVYNSLAKLGQAEVVEEAVRTPAVSVRASVKADALTCLECGQRMKMLKRHLTSEHSLTPAEYRARWGLDSSYPLVAPDYASRRRELAQQIGLGRKPAVKVAAPKADAPKAPAKTAKPRAPRKPKA